MELDEFERTGGGKMPAKTICSKADSHLGATERLDEDLAEYYGIGYPYPYGCARDYYGFQLGQRKELGAYTEE